MLWAHAFLLDNSQHCEILGHLQKLSNRSQVQARETTKEHEDSKASSYVKAAGSTFQKKVNPNIWQQNLNAFAKSCAHSYSRTDSWHSHPSLLLLSLIWRRWLTKGYGFMGTGIASVPRVRNQGFDVTNTHFLLQAQENRITPVPSAARDLLNKQIGVEPRSFTKSNFIHLYRYYRALLTWSIYRKCNYYVK